MTYRVVVCAPAPQASASEVCPAGYLPQLVDAPLFSPSFAARLEASAEPFDPATASAFFAFGFAATVGWWLFCHGAGLILKAVRQW